MARATVSLIPKRPRSPGDLAGRRAWRDAGAGRRSACGRAGNAVPNHKCAAHSHARRRRARRALPGRRSAPQAVNAVLVNVRAVPEMNGALLAHCGRRR
ncbi:MAG: hypothetical protein R2838_08350 [Caldilineaceae bacterium]